MSVTISMFTNLQFCGVTDTNSFGQHFSRSTHTMHASHTPSLAAAAYFTMPRLYAERFAPCLIEVDKLSAADRHGDTRASSKNQLI